MPAFVKLGDIKADTANSVVVQPESLILPTDGDDILVVKPEANDILTGLDVGPVNKLADNGWWTVDGADFREPQKDSLTNVGKEGFTWEAASDIWTNGGASTFAEIEIDSMVLQDNGIGSEHWPEPAAELLALGSAVAALGSASMPGTN